MRKRQWILWISMVWQVMLWNVAAQTSGTCGEGLTWTLSEDSTVLTISGRGEMTDYYSAADVPWYDYRSTITSLTIDDGVTYVGDYAFRYCSILAQVSFPASIDSIGSKAFYNTGLTEVTMPENIKYVGQYAFGDCKNLTTVHWNAVNSQVSSPFYKSTSLSTVTFGEQVGKIPDYLMLGCSGLTEITIPASIDSIGSRAFCSTGLTEVTIPEHIKYVGSNAFLDCKNLATVHWNAGISKVSSPFYNCPSLTMVTFGENVKKVPEELFDDCTGLTEITIPASIDSIGSKAFYNTGLTEVTIPENIKYVGQYAFQGCKNLATVHWNATHCEDFLYSSSSPFYNIPSLKTVTFGESVKKVPDNLFYDCTGLTQVSIPASIDSIGDYVFSNTSLTEVTIPENVKYVGSSAFQGCKNLTTVHWNAVNSQVSSPFSGCTALSTVTFGEQVGKIPDYLMLGCSGLTEITIPASIDSIGSSAFSSTGLTEVTIPENIKYVGSSAFQGCKNLTTVHWNAVNTTRSWYTSLFIDCTALSTVTFGESVENVPSDLFYDCTTLTQVSFSASVDSIGSYAFSNTGLTEVTIPENVKYVGSSAFQGCKNLTTVHWNAVNTTRGWYTSLFIDCTALSTVTFGESVKKVPDHLFYDCTALTQVSFSTSIDSIGSSAFSNTSLTDVTIPENIKYVGSSAFQGCKNLTTVHWNAVNSRVSSPFSGCTALSTVTFGESVEKVPDYLFFDYTTLTHITLANGVDSIGEYAFSRTSLSDLAIPQSLVYIGKSAFRECDSLRHLTFEPISTLEVIEEYAFYACPLEGYEIPSSIRFIGENAFDGYRKYMKKLTITQSMVDTAYICDILVIDTLIIADDVKNIDFTKIFDDKVQIGYLGGTLPDTMATWQLPIRSDGKHPYDVYQTVYDINGDGLMEFVVDQKDSKIGQVRNYYGFNIDTVCPKSSKFLVEFVNVRNGEDEDIMLYYKSNDYFVGLFQKEKGDYQEYFCHATYENYDVLDLNGDGLPDLFCDEDALLQQRDGTFLPVNFKELTSEEVDSMIYQTEGLIGKGGVSASVVLGFSSYVVSAYDSEATSSMPARRVMDIDCNGYPDVLDLRSGNVWFNYGNNYCRKGNLGTNILAIKDLNGDGVTDLLVYDDKTQEVKLVMYVDGELTSRVLTTDLIVTNAWCYDFDHDGDADILLAFDYQSNMGWSFLIFYRNDGNNEFKKKESAFEEDLRFFECMDIDNDGMYEVLADTYQGSEYENTRLIKCSHELVAELNPEPFLGETSSDPMVNIGDFDGNGLIEYVYEIDNDHYGFRRIPGKQNTPPARMECPSIIFDGVAQKLNVSWTLGSDAESSPIDLTYALRIGSAPGKGDMFCANATPEGRRLNLEDGNMGSSLSTWIDVSNWPAGDYYLAVQAVDPNHMGGAWSEECVYHHDILSANFTVDRLNLPSSDTLTIVYDGQEQEGYTYKWSLGDSVVVISSENTRHQLQYLSTGKKTISLQVFDAEGNASPVVMQEITVVPAKYEKFYAPDLLADWDMNGTIDGVSRNGFYANDGNGIFKSIGKSFNMNNTINLDYNPYIADYNRDGLVDLLAQSNKGNVYINEGEQDFSIETVGTVLFDNSYYFIPDLDNDGLPDCYDLIYIYPVTEDLQYDSNKKEYLGYLSYDHIFFVDVDRDGYTDILYTSTIKDAEENLAFYIKRNQGNWTFTPAQLLYTCPMNTSYVNVGDVDNDGYLDIVFSKNNNTLVVAYGDADYKYTDVREVYLPEKYTINTEKDKSINFSDVDNDGYLDVTFSACVVCFRPNRSYEVFTNENLDVFSSEELIMDMNGDGSPDSKGFLMYTGISNTAPETPTNLRVLQNGDGVVLEWDDSYDRETPKIRMRYNVSLKKKGATGENSYIISPLNGENDEVTIVPSHTYLESTRMVIPLKCFELGEEYEFRVQAIDLWNTVSPMSAPCEFVFEDQTVLIPLSDKVCAGDLLEFHYDATSVGTPQWDTDGGELFENEDKVFMSWSTGGTKKVSLTMNGKTVTRSIYVIPEDTTDLTFTLPPMVLGECNIPFTLPEVCRDPSNKVSITTSSPDVVVERYGSSLDAWVRFPAKEGVYSVTLEYDANTSCGNRMYTQSVMVNGTDVKPVISIVSVDGLTGKTTIQWDIPDDVLNNPIFDRVIVYKEEGRTNNFVKLAEVLLTEHQFVDLTSDPSVRKSRYRITLGTTYGGESNPSDVHSNVHVMLNKGLNNAVNIMWSEYEGALIDQYIIWRGTSLDNMQILTTVSGSETSFTDFTAPEGENLYYALSYSNVYETEWIKYTASYPAMAYSVMAYSAANVAEGFSNFTTTNEGIVAMLPTSLSIVSLEKVMELTPEQSVIHLLADLLPTTTTVKQVRWSIKDGAEFAQISSNGTLQYKGTGETEWLTVFAETIDGSNLSATARIPVKGFDSQEPEEPEEPSMVTADTASVSIKIYPNPTLGDFVIDGITGYSDVFIYSIEGILMMKSSIIGKSELSITGLYKGTYILIIKDEKRDILIRRKVIKL